MPLGSSTGNYNVLTGFCLTSTAGDAAAKTVEIGSYLHPSTSATAFARTRAVIGDYQDQAGRAWRITKAGQFIMVTPAGGGDMLAGTLDVRHPLSFLTAKGAIAGSEWFNGMAIDVEPVRGQSNVTINRRSVQES